MTSAQKSRASACFNARAVYKKSDCFLCPAGRVLSLEAATAMNQRGSVYRRYRAEREDCSVCPLRKRCLLDRAGAARRTLHIPKQEQQPMPQTLSQKMRAKIDLPESRRLYSQRLAIVEPVFANLRSNKGMDRFTYRGKEKVSVQWLCFCLVHNLEKLAHFGQKYGKKKLLKKVKGALYCFFSWPWSLFGSSYGQLLVPASTLPSFNLLPNAVGR
jgi:Transposase DDE domain